VKLQIFQIDAFTDTLFGGNPAAVCPLDDWLEDETLQHIAAENNLSETAFYVPDKGCYQLRWFTPRTEVDLCGHATLATAWVLENAFGQRQFPIRFMTRSGELRAEKVGAQYALDFPLRRPEPCPAPPGLLFALGLETAEVLAAEDYLVIVPDEDCVKSLRPDFGRLKEVPLRGVIVSAPGDAVDFVSRFFAPNVGIDEDPVTGSAHTILAPYWAQKLAKKELVAMQISKRTGKLECTIAGDRVLIKGSAVKYMEGFIELLNF
jgi:predicted PhzF superfamily epimerase YddE/YHI9